MSEENIKYDDNVEEEIFYEERLKESEELENLKKQVEELQTKYLYAAAENQNLNKRFAAERGYIIDRTTTQVVDTFLPVIDDFERAIAHNDNIEDIEVMRNAFHLIYNKFLASLDILQVKKIESDGAEFNVDLHEAIAQVPVMDEEQKGKVVSTTTTGYMLRDKVLRYAKVVVGQKD